jgi:hypothetical protein
MSTVREGRTHGAPAEHLDRCAPHRPRRDTMVAPDRLGRLRAESAGHVMLSIDASSQRCPAALQLLDCVGARLTSALAGDVGGRITVCITRQGDDVVLELRTARPGSWTRALQRVAFDNLLAELSSSVMKRGGTLVIGVGSFGRLHATVRVKACSGTD